MTDPRPPMAPDVAARETEHKLKPQYPDYLDDPDGLERFRQAVRATPGHDMAAVNHNSLGRLIDTIDRLRRERDAATPSTDPRSRGQAEEREAAHRMLEGDPEENNGIRPAVTFADHSYPAYSKQQMVEFALAFAAAIRSGETPVGEGRGWRSEMENAPRDGTVVDLWSVFDNGGTKTGERLVSCRWRNESLTYDTGWHDCFGNKIEWSGDDGCSRSVTHWMPLPDAPAAEVGHG